MGTEGLSWRAWWTRPPVVARRDQSARATGGLFIGCAVVAFTTTVVPGGPASEEVAYRLVSLAALLLGALVVAVPSLLVPWAYHAVVASGAVMGAVGLLACGSPVMAVSLSVMYVLILASTACVSSWLACLVHVILYLLSVTISLSMVPGVRAAPIIVVAGCLVLVPIVVGYLARANAITETDPLTGLLNRRGLQRQLGSAITAAERSGTPCAVALVDLDHFKTINDGGGHSAGDRLLISTARAWQQELRGEDAVVLARTGGDEFTVLVHGGDAAAVADVVDRLRRQLPAGRTCSAGTAQWEVGDSSSLLLNRADTALYQVKRSARGTTSEHVSVAAVGAELRRALELGQLEVHYQPVVAIGLAAEGQGAHATVSGAEALLRWRHPERGLVPPADFLPQAESSGAIVEMGRWIIERACFDAAAWPLGPDGRPLTIAVNAACRELEEPGYASWVSAVLSRSGLPASALVLEITEGVLDLESATVLECLHALRAAGVRLAIDDFGTGYSSFARLGTLPLDILKIDRSFVAAISHENAEAPLVASILALAQAMGLEVVAEGIETPAHAEWLRRRSCDQAQGWLWSAAVPAPAFLALVCGQPSRPASSLQPST